VESTRKDIVEEKPEESTKPEKKPEDKKPEKKPEGDKEDKKPAGDKEDKKPEAKKPDGNVQGKVTFEGKPLPGTITLTAKDGTIVSGAIDADGAYRVEAVKPGAYTVSVNVKDKTVNLPKKYTEADKSGLMCEVVAGNQTFDLELK
jgi:hypothetical protein